MMLTPAGRLATPSASSFASFKAPAGTHWEFVTAKGVRITDPTRNNEPAVALVGDA